VADIQNNKLIFKYLYYYIQIIEKYNLKPLYFCGAHMLYCLLPFIISMFLLGLFHMCFNRLCYFSQNIILQFVFLRNINLFCCVYFIFHQIIIGFNFIKKYKIDM
jgi:hypothetical protein